jgi:hypothetical protein
MAWDNFKLDQVAHDLVYANRNKEAFSEAHKMRTTVSYGLERFWGEQLRLKGDEQKFWTDTWNKFCEVMLSVGIELPSGADPSVAPQLWDVSKQDQRKVALAVLTQLCDCIVWWVQRYKHTVEDSRDVANA